MPRNTFFELYLVAEALRHLAETLPEEHGGLACLIELLSREVTRLVAVMDKPGQ